MQKRKKFSPLKSIGISVVVLSLVLWFFATIHQVTIGQKEEGAQMMERTIRRAAVTCYAVEGIYPPSLDYLVEHYGLQLQEDRYQVFYEGFAENLMPDITVLEKKTP